MKYTVILLLLILSGCATSTLVWEHTQGLDAEQRLLAQQECRELAHREARYQSFFYDGLFFPLRSSFYYHERYYAPSPFWYEHNRQMRYHDNANRFYRLCMEAKGWRLIRHKTEPSVP